MHAVAFSTVTISQIYQLAFSLTK